MDDLERGEPDGTHDADVTRLPVPREDRSPTVRRAEVVPAEPADALVRAMSGSPLAAAPMLGVAVAAATAAVVVSGVAAASRWMWPWLAGGAPQGPGWPGSTGGLGPGLHVSYTHVELHWPSGR